MKTSALRRSFLALSIAALSLGGLSLDAQAQAAKKDLVIGGTFTQVGGLARKGLAFLDGLGTALPQIRGGAIRALGVASDAPNAALPGVPTIASVLPGFLSVNWTGLFALRGTPETVLARIDAETRAALAGPEMAVVFRDRAFDPMPIPRADLPAFVAAESTRWREAVRASGARAE